MLQQIDSLRVDTLVYELDEFVTKDDMDAAWKWLKED